MYAHKIIPISPDLVGVDGVRGSKWLEFFTLIFILDGDKKMPAVRYAITEIGDGGSIARLPASSQGYIKKVNAKRYIHDNLF